MHALISKLPLKKIYYFFNLLQKIFLCLACLFLFLMLFFKSNFFSHSWLIPPHANSFYGSNEVQDEKYDGQLRFLDSMSKLEKYFILSIEKKQLTKIEAIYFADQLLRKRFFHKNKTISLRDNWFLYLFNYFSENKNNTLYISSLDPDYILKSSHAYCNQQALIFQKLMQATNIDYQSVMFSIPRSPVTFGHFASAASSNGQWFFIDSNLEPSYDEGDHLILPSLLNGDVKLFNKLYPDYTVDLIPEGSISVGYLNKNPAFYGYWLQKITYIFSNYAWLLMAVAYLGCKLTCININKKIRF